MNQLPEGCRLTVVSDSCHSGGLIDKTKEQIGESTEFHEDPDAPPPENNEEEPTETVDEETAEREEYADEEEQAEKAEEEEAAEYGGADCNVKNRAISLRDLVEIIRQKTGNEDVEAGDIRQVLYDIFGEEANPVVYGGQRLYGGGGGGEGILISGCQSFQLSQDIGGEEPYGLLSGTILMILDETEGDISNRELVQLLREKLTAKGFKQRPGLYCSD